MERMKLNNTTIAYRETTYVRAYRWIARAGERARRDAYRRVGGRGPIIGTDKRGTLAKLAMSAH